MRQARVRLLVAEVVTNVGKPRAFGLQFRDERERLLDIRMRRVRDVAQRIEDEIIQSAQQSFRTFRDGAEIRQVSKVAESKTQNRLNSMHRGNRRDVQTKEIEGSVNLSQLDQGQRASGLSFFEDVRELSFQYGERVVRCVDRHERLLLKIEWADVVKPHDMVGVTVRENDRIQAVDVSANRLKAKIGSGVDHDALPAIREPDRRTRALVVRVGGFANRAMAAEAGNAH